MRLEEMRQKAKDDLNLTDELDRESLANGRKTAQWSEFLSLESVNYKRAQFQLRKKTTELFEKYFTKYNITLSEKQVREIYLPGDPEIQDLEGKLAVCEEKVNLCERTIRALSQNTFHIKNVIEYRKFMSGIL